MTKLGKGRIPSRITMMDLRQQPGEILRAVEVERRSIEVQKNGTPVAKITPIDGDTIIHPDGTISGEMPITFRRNLGGGY